MRAVDLRFKILDDPDKRLHALKRGMRNRILRKAVRAAARLVQVAAKRLAPRLSGTLAASMAVRIATHRRTGAIYAVIGPRRRFQRKRKGKVTSVGLPTKIAHLVMGGTRSHSTRPGDTLGRTRVSRNGKTRVTATKQTGRQHPGAKANPFLRRAWDEEMRPALDRMREVITQELAKLGDGSSADAG